MRPLVMSLVACALSCLGFVHAAAQAPTAVRTPVAGSPVPQATVSLDGASIDLTDYFASGKHVVMVYRGGWCPICTRHFVAVGKAKKMLSQSGWQLVGLSPDSEASIAAWYAKHGKDDIVRLSDSKAAAIEALGLGFSVDDQTMDVLKSYKIDIEQAAGETHRILPVPTVLLIVDGEIRYVHADADYRRRLDPAVLKAAVKAIAAQK